MVKTFFEHLTGWLKKHELFLILAGVGEIGAFTFLFTDLNKGFYKNTGIVEKESKITESNRQESKLISEVDSLNYWYETIKKERKNLEMYVLDKNFFNYNPSLDDFVKKYPKAEEYIPYIQEAIKDVRYIFPLDPILVLSLICAESEFNRFAISPRGAAGPLQLIPSTAKGFGLKVYYPDYLKEAEKLQKEANKLYAVALSSFLKEDFEVAKSTLLQHKKIQKKADSLFLYYKRDLLEKIKGKPDSVIKNIDERFILDKAVSIGVKYLAMLMDKRDGDIREGLSAYNAGLGNVQKARGIPFIRESVLYQNWIMNLYKEFKKEDDDFKKEIYYR